MKRNILTILFLICFPVLAFAQPNPGDLMGLGMPAGLASLLGTPTANDITFSGLTPKILGPSSDAAKLSIAPTDAVTGSDGAWCQMSGASNADGGDLVLNATDDIVLQVDGSSVLTVDDGNNRMVLANGQQFRAENASDLGWAVVAGANTACNTTCGYACVFGVNTASATADIVDCADATADECLCAGPS